MIANFEYGNYDITINKKYKITNYKDCILQSASNLTKEETQDSLEDSLKEFSTKREIKVKSGTNIGIFYPDDDYDIDELEGSYKLDGEVNFTKKGLIYNDSYNENHSGDISKWIIVLGDDKFISDGEYAIITKENNEDELNKFNKAINKKFDIIILSLS
jgi:hypothetical protein